jgi:DNA repair exonuclease SbcCD ATPase subunit
MKEKEKQINTDWRNRVSQIEQNNLEEMNKQHLEHTKLQDLLREQIEKFESQILFLENKYENREPRPEDIELIRKLTVECQEYRKKLQQLKEEMKFYKLELINREETYNKIFGSSPKVGVMNPVAGKVSSGKSLNSTSSTNLTKVTSITMLPPLSPKLSPRIINSTGAPSSKGALPS